MKRIQWWIFDFMYWGGYYHAEISFSIGRFEIIIMWERGERPDDYGMSEM